MLENIIKIHQSQF